uniref:Uncharacterized protein n=1 Tax=Arundo donax TaxID=35708 RepID=A0A0A8YAK2_ARUDO
MRKLFSTVHSMALTEPAHSLLPRILTKSIERDKYLLRARYATNKLLKVRLL